jgi:hypothetical protein
VQSHAQRWTEPDRFQDPSGLVKRTLPHDDPLAFPFVPINPTHPATSPRTLLFPACVAAHYYRLPSTHRFASLPRLASRLAYSENPQLRPWNRRIPSAFAPWLSADVILPPERSVIPQQLPRQQASSPGPSASAATAILSSLEKGLLLLHSLRHLQRCMRWDDSQRRRMESDGRLRS